MKVIPERNVFGRCTNPVHRKDTVRDLDYTTTYTPMATIRPLPKVPSLVGQGNILRL
jgi:hypothetical protein